MKKVVEKEMNRWKNNKFEGKIQEPAGRSEKKNHGEKNIEKKWKNVKKSLISLYEKRLLNNG